MFRLGLCCVFNTAPIKFRTTTAAYLIKQSRQDALLYISSIVLSNMQSLKASIEFCIQHNIGSFRILSQIWPLYTHPKVGYELEDLGNYEDIQRVIEECRSLKALHDIRLTLHPDQFVVLNSPERKIVEASIQELEYHALVAELLDADVINIHAGGVYGDKSGAMERFVANFSDLSPAVKCRLTVENDDRSYSPEDLLPLCMRLNIPLCYDIHHHRCCGDSLSIEEASRISYTTWNREPLFHISSPLRGWGSTKTRSHADFINIEDFPKCWFDLSPLTIEVEAKAKEIAIQKLQSDLEQYKKSLHRS